MPEIGPESAESWDPPTASATAVATSPACGADSQTSIAKSPASESPWVSLRQESSRKEEVPRTQKPFVATLRVNESRPAELGPAAGSEFCVGRGRPLTAKRKQRSPNAVPIGPRNTHCRSLRCRHKQGPRRYTPQWPGVPWSRYGSKNRACGTRGWLGNLRDPSVSTDISGSGTEITNSPAHGPASGRWEQTGRKGQGGIAKRRRRGAAAERDGRESRSVLS